MVRAEHGPLGQGRGSHVPHASASVVLAPALNFKHNFKYAKLEGDFEMATYFRNPDTGQVVRATGGFTWLCQLLVSPIHFSIHNMWKHAAISLVAWIVTLSFSGILYAFLGYSIIKNHYRQLGWKEVPPDLIDIARAQYKNKITLTKRDLSGNEFGEPRL